MMNINGFNICAAPYLTEMKEVHRKPRKWARRVMFQRYREYDIEFSEIPSRQVIKAGNALYMHPAMIDELSKQLDESK